MKYSEFFGLWVSVFLFNIMRHNSILTYLFLIRLFVEIANIRKTSQRVTRNFYWNIEMSGNFNWNLKIPMAFWNWLFTAWFHGRGRDIFYRIYKRWCSKNFFISNIDIFIVNNKQPSIISHDKQMQKSFKILI